LGRQTMGDQVKVIYYRGAEKKTATLELKKLPIPEVPDTHQEFMSKLEEIFQNSLQFLKEAVESVSDEAASWKPAPEEWSIKETLAHIIHTERDNQFWLHAKILDEDFNWLDNTKERVVATVEAYPRVEELLYEINRAQKETLAFVKNMPDSLISRKTTFWHLAQGILTADSHTREHIDQIQQNLRAYASLQKP
ncbi:MAG: DinB family protein, partial [Bellilinea sp.]